MRRHGQAEPQQELPEDEDLRLIAEALTAPLSVCPYRSRYADSDPAHPCHTDCLGEC
jgi:hypothetical protein